MSKTTRLIFVFALLLVCVQPTASAAAPAREPQDHPLSPAESLARFEIAPDLEIEQLLAEPVVRQPVFVMFDERGRLWVVQYIQYPDPAGLTMMSRDNVWRAVYDKVPPPPPRHFPGADKITIHEDTNGDGRFDRHKTFLEGLNIVTAVARGRGGVWVMNPPYLLFYPDKDNDDVPDGDPVVHLAGFGLEDTHSVANSLRWGPDGWLYAAQGSTVTANITRPGLDEHPIFSMGQLIWRYHPETRRYEVFSEGGGNAFGVEIDTKGRIFSGHNGGNTRGFHYMQGAYLQKGFEKHGPLSNPYAFGYFRPMPHPDVDRFTHNFVIYDGGSLPDRYDGKLFGIEPLQGRVVYSEILPDQSSFKTVDIGHPVRTTDQWFRPVDIKVGPDGAIYLADWYDRQVNHYRNHEGQIDKNNGRIYRLKRKGAPAPGRFNLAELSARELLPFLDHPNKWFRQEALRLLGDRRDASVISDLVAKVRSGTGQGALEGLWALNVSGGFDDDRAYEFLGHSDPFVRLWTVRLLGDTKAVSARIEEKLAALAMTETNLEVRGQLACTAKRLPAADGLQIVRNLLSHSEDAADNRIPLLLWWAVEARCGFDPDAVLELFADPAVWRLPLVEQHLLDRLMRRFAMSGTRQDLLRCARLFRLSPGAEQSGKLLAGFEEAFRGRAMGPLPLELSEVLARLHGGSVTLGVRRGDEKAIQAALEKLGNHSAPAAERLEIIQVLGETKCPEAPPALLNLLRDNAETSLHKAVLTALQQFDRADIGDTVLARFPSLREEAKTAAVALLCSRAVWAGQLLAGLQKGTVDRSELTQDTIRKLQQYQEPEIVRLLKGQLEQVRKPTPQELQVQITRIAASLRNGEGSPYEGQKLFNATCAACHRLFGQGGQIGPDLTTYKRDDLDTVLLSIVHPNAEIREGYENFIVTTRDGRTLSGFLADRDTQVVILRGVDGENIAIPQKEVEQMEAAGISLMPEGLLDSFNDQQIRDLFAYLRSTQPLVR